MSRALGRRHTGAIAVLLPIAHAGHWLWVLYIPPVLIVLASIVRVAISERRKGREKRGD